MLNERENAKKKSEKDWAGILIRHLNNKGCDYAISVCDVSSDWADVDVCAFSASGKFEPLYLQLCLDVKPGDEGFERLPNTSKSHTFKNFGDTMGAITGKAEKYAKQNKDVSNITIVIQSYYLVDEDKDYFTKLNATCGQFGFKAVYIVSPKGEIHGELYEPRFFGPEQVFKIC